MRFTRSPKTLYFLAGPVLHKCLEVGGGVAACSDKGFDWYFRIHTKGDHAGLTFFIELFGWLFEFNIHDERHWNWRADRFYEPGEEPEPVFEGYPHE